MIGREKEEGGRGGVRARTTLPPPTHGIGENITKKRERGGKGMTRPNEIEGKKGEKKKVRDEREGKKKKEKESLNLRGLGHVEKEQEGSTNNLGKKEQGEKDTTTWLMKKGRGNLCHEADLREP